MNSTGGREPDVEAHARQLAVSDTLRGPAILSAIRTLNLPSGSWGLDAGCGIGSHTLLLAEATGPIGHVTGLDVSAGLLARGREMAERAGLSRRVAFREGDITRLPFDDHTFDWVWSADCAGYGPFEPFSLLKELARVVKPGGAVAILAWSSEKLLPGYPLLEARMSATAAGISPFVEGQDPQTHFLRAPTWFREAGLEGMAADTFAGSVCAPLNDDMRDALTALFGMRWPGVASELTADDWAEYERLCLPESPDFILHHPDYCAFFTYSMFHAKVTT